MWNETLMRLLLLFEALCLPHLVPPKNVQNSSGDVCTACSHELPCRHFILVAVQWVDLALLCCSRPARREKRRA